MKKGSGNSHLTPPPTQSPLHDHGHPLRGTPPHPMVYTSPHQAMHQESMLTQMTQIYPELSVIPDNSRTPCLIANSRKPQPKLLDAQEPSSSLLRIDSSLHLSNNVTINPLGLSSMVGLEPAQISNDSHIGSSFGGSKKLPEFSQIKQRKVSSTPQHDPGFPILLDNHIIGQHNLAEFEKSFNDVIKSNLNIIDSSIIASDGNEFDSSHYYRNTPHLLEASSNSAMNAHVIDPSIQSSPHIQHSPHMQHSPHLQSSPHVQNSPRLIVESSSSFNSPDSHHSLTNTEYSVESDVTPSKPPLQNRLFDEIMNERIHIESNIAAMNFTPLEECLLQGTFNLPTDIPSALEKSISMDIQRENMKSSKLPDENKSAVKKPSTLEAQPKRLIQVRNDLFQGNSEEINPKSSNTKPQSKYKLLRTKQSLINNSKKEKYQNIETGVVLDKNSNTIQQKPSLEAKNKVNKPMIYAPVVNEKKVVDPLTTTLPIPTKPAAKTIKNVPKMNLVKSTKETRQSHSVLPINSVEVSSLPIKISNTPRQDPVLKSVGKPLTFQNDKKCESPKKIKENIIMNFEPKAQNCLNSATKSPKVSTNSSTFDPFSFETESEKIPTNDSLVKKATKEQLNTSINTSKNSEKVKDAPKTLNQVIPSNIKNDLKESNIAKKESKQESYENKQIDNKKKESSTLSCTESAGLKIRIKKNDSIVKNKNEDKIDNSESISENSSTCLENKVNKFSKTAIEEMKNIDHKTKSPSHAIVPASVTSTLKVDIPEPDKSSMMTCTMGLNPMSLKLKFIKNSPNTESHNETKHVSMSDDKGSNNSRVTLRIKVPPSSESKSSPKRNIIEEEPLDSRVPEKLIINLKTNQITRTNEDGNIANSNSPVASSAQSSSSLSPSKSKLRSFHKVDEICQNLQNIPETIPFDKTDESVNMVITKSDTSHDPKNISEKSNINILPEQSKRMTIKFRRMSKSGENIFVKHCDSTEVINETDDESQPCSRVSNDKSQDTNDVFQKPELKLKIRIGKEIISEQNINKKIKKKKKHKSKKHREKLKKLFEAALKEDAQFYQDKIKNTLTTNLEKDDSENIVKPLILKRKNDVSCFEFAENVEPKVIEEHVTENIHLSDRLVGVDLGPIQTPDAPTVKDSIVLATEKTCAIDLIKEPSQELKMSNCLLSVTGDNKLTSSSNKGVTSDCGNVEQKATKPASISLESKSSPKSSEQTTKSCDIPNVIEDACTKLSEKTPLTKETPVNVLSEESTTDALKNYICESCRKEFETEFEFNKHKILIHQYNAFLCHICYVSFVEKWKLEIHLMSEEHLAMESNQHKKKNIPPTDTSQTRVTRSSKLRNNDSHETINNKRKVSRQKKKHENEANICTTSNEPSGVDKIDQEENIPTIFSNDTILSSISHNAPSISEDTSSFESWQKITEDVPNEITINISTNINQSTTVNESRLKVIEDTLETSNEVTINTTPDIIQSTGDKGEETHSNKTNKPIVDIGGHENEIYSNLLESANLDIQSSKKLTNEGQVHLEIIENVSVTLPDESKSDEVEHKQSSNIGKVQSTQIEISSGSQTSNNTKISLKSFNNNDASVKSSNDISESLSVSSQENKVDEQIHTAETTNISSVGIDESPSITLDLLEQSIPTSIITTRRLTIRTKEMTRKNICATENKEISKSEGKDPTSSEIKINPKKQLRPLPKLRPLPDLIKISPENMKLIPYVKPNLTNYIDFSNKKQDKEKLTSALSIAHSKEIDSNKHIEVNCHSNIDIYSRAQNYENDTARPKNTNILDENAVVTNDISRSETFEPPQELVSSSSSKELEINNKKNENIESEKDEIPDIAEKVVCDDTHIETRRSSRIKNTVVTFTNKSSTKQKTAKEITKNPITPELKKTESPVKNTIAENKRTPNKSVPVPNNNSPNQKKYDSNETPTKIEVPKIEIVENSIELGNECGSTSDLSIDNEVNQNQDIMSLRKSPRQVNNKHVEPRKSPRNRHSCFTSYNEELLNNESKYKYPVYDECQNTVVKAISKNHSRRKTLDRVIEDKRSNLNFIVGQIEIKNSNAAEKFEDIHDCEFSKSKILTNEDLSQGKGGSTKREASKSESVNNFQDIQCSKKKENCSISALNESPRSKDDGESHGLENTQGTEICDLNKPIIKTSGLDTHSIVVTSSPVFELHPISEPSHDSHDVLTLRNNKKSKTSSPLKSRNKKYLVKKQLEELSQLVAQYSPLENGVNPANKHSSKLPTKTECSKIKTRRKTLEECTNKESEKEILESSRQDAIPENNPPLRKSSRARKIKQFHDEILNGFIKPQRKTHKSSTVNIALVGNNLELTPTEDKPLIERIDVKSLGLNSICTKQEKNICSPKKTEHGEFMDDEKPLIDRIDLYSIEVNHIHKKSEKPKKSDTSVEKSVLLVDQYKPIDNKRNVKSQPINSSVGNERHSISEEKCNELQIFKKLEQTPTHKNKHETSRNEIEKEEINEHTLESSKEAVEKNERNNETYVIHDQNNITHCTTKNKNTVEKFDSNASKTLGKKSKVDKQKRSLSGNSMDVRKETVVEVDVQSLSLVGPENVHEREMKIDENNVELTDVSKNKEIVHENNLKANTGLPTGILKNVKRKSRRGKRKISCPSRKSKRLKIAKEMCIKTKEATAIAKLTKTHCEREENISIQKHNDTDEMIPYGTMENSKKVRSAKHIEKVIDKKDEHEETDVAEKQKEPFGTEVIIENIIEKYVKEKLELTSESKENIIKTKHNEENVTENEEENSLVETDIEENQEVPCDTAENDIVATIVEEIQEVTCKMEENIIVETDVEKKQEIPRERADNIFVATIESNVVETDVEGKQEVPCEIDENFVIQKDVEGNRKLSSETEKRYVFETDIKENQELLCEKAENIFVETDVEENQEVPIETEKNIVVEDNQEVPCELKENIVEEKNEEPCRTDENIVGKHVEDKPDKPCKTEENIVEEKQEEPCETEENIIVETDVEDKEEEQRETEENIVGRDVEENQKKLCETEENIIVEIDFEEKKEEICETEENIFADEKQKEPCETGKNIVVEIVVEGNREGSCVTEENIVVEKAEEPCETDENVDEDNQKVVSTVEEKHEETCEALKNIIVETDVEEKQQEYGQTEENIVVEIEENIVEKDVEKKQEELFGTEENIVFEENQEGPCGIEEDILVETDIEEKQEETIVAEEKQRGPCEMAGNIIVETDVEQNQDGPCETQKYAVVNENQKFGSTVEEKHEETCEVEENITVETDVEEQREEHCETEENIVVETEKNIVVRDVEEKQKGPCGTEENVLFETNIEEKLDEYCKTEERTIVGTEKSDVIETDIKENQKLLCERAENIFLATEESNVVETDVEENQIVPIVTEENIVVAENQEFGSTVQKKNEETCEVEENIIVVTDVEEKREEHCETEEFIVVETEKNIVERDVEEKQGGPCGTEENILFETHVEEKLEEQCKTVENTIVDTEENIVEEKQEEPCETEENIIVEINVKDKEEKSRKTEGIIVVEENQKVVTTVEEKHTEILEIEENIVVDMKQKGPCETGENISVETDVEEKQENHCESKENIEEKQKETCETVPSETERNIDSESDVEKQGIPREMEENIVEETNEHREAKTNIVAEDKKQEEPCETEENIGLKTNVEENQVLVATIEEKHEEICETEEKIDVEKDVEDKQEQEKPRETEENIVVEEKVERSCETNKNFVVDTDVEKRQDISSEKENNIFVKTDVEENQEASREAEDNIVVEKKQEGPCGTEVNNVVEPNVEVNQKIVVTVNEKREKTCEAEQNNVVETDIEEKQAEHCETEENVVERYVEKQEETCETEEHIVVEEKQEGLYSTDENMVVETDVQETQEEPCETAENFVETDIEIEQEIPCETENNIVYKTDVEENQGAPGEAEENIVVEDKREEPCDSGENIVVEPNIIKKQEEHCETEDNVVEYNQERPCGTEENILVEITVEEKEEELDETEENIVIDISIKEKQQEPCETEEYVAERNQEEPYSTEKTILVETDIEKKQEETCETKENIVVETDVEENQVGLCGTEENILVETEENIVFGTDVIENQEGLCGTEENTVVERDVEEKQEEPCEMEENIVFEEKHERPCETEENIVVEPNIENNQNVVATVEEKHEKSCEAEKNILVDTDVEEKQEESCNREVKIVVEEENEGHCEIEENIVEIDVEENQSVVVTNVEEDYKGAFETEESTVEENQKEPCSTEQNILVETEENIVFGTDVVENQEGPCKTEANIVVERDVEEKQEEPCETEENIVFEEKHQRPCETEENIVVEPNIEYNQNFVATVEKYHEKSCEAEENILVQTDVEEKPEESCNGEVKIVVEEENEGPCETEENIVTTDVEENQSVFATNVVENHEKTCVAEENILVETDVEEKQEKICEREVKNVIEEKKEGPCEKEENFVETDVEGNQNVFAINVEENYEGAFETEENFVVEEIQEGPWERDESIVVLRNVKEKQELPCKLEEIIVETTVADNEEKLCETKLEIGNECQEVLCKTDEKIVVLNGVEENVSEVERNRGNIVIKDIHDAPYNVEVMKKSSEQEDNVDERSQGEEIFQRQCNEEVKDNEICETGKDSEKLKEGKELSNKVDYCEEAMEIKCETHKDDDKIVDFKESTEFSNTKYIRDSEEIIGIEYNIKTSKIEDVSEKVIEIKGNKRMSEKENNTENKEKLINTEKNRKIIGKRRENEGECKENAGEAAKPEGNIKEIAEPEKNKVKSTECEKSNNVESDIEENTEEPTEIEDNKESANDLKQNENRSNDSEEKKEIVNEEEKVDREPTESEDDMEITIKVLRIKEEPQEIEEEKDLVCEVDDIQSEIGIEGEKNSIIESITNEFTVNTEVKHIENISDTISINERHSSIVEEEKVTFYENRETISEIVEKNGVEENETTRKNTAILSNTVQDKETADEIMKDQLKGVEKNDSISEMTEKLLESLKENEAMNENTEEISDHVMRNETTYKNTGQLSEAIEENKNTSKNSHTISDIVEENMTDKNSAIVHEKETAHKYSQKVSNILNENKTNNEIGEELSEIVGENKEKESEILDGNREKPSEIVDKNKSIENREKGSEIVESGLSCGVKEGLSDIVRENKFNESSDKLIEICEESKATNVQVEKPTAIVGNSETSKVNKEELSDIVEENQTNENLKKVSKNENETSKEELSDFVDESEATNKKREKGLQIEHECKKTNDIKEDLSYGVEVKETSYENAEKVEENEATKKKIVEPFKLLVQKEISNEYTEKTSEISQGKEANDKHTVKTTEENEEKIKANTEKTDIGKEKDLINEHVQLTNKGKNDITNEEEETIENIQELVRNIVRKSVDKPVQSEHNIDNLKEDEENGIEILLGEVENIGETNKTKSCKNEKKSREEKVKSCREEENKETPKEALSKVQTTEITEQLPVESSAQTNKDNNRVGLLEEQEKGKSEKKTNSPKSDHNTVQLVKQLHKESIKMNLGENEETGEAEKEVSSEEDTNNIQLENKADINGAASTKTNESNRSPKKKPPQQYQCKKCFEMFGNMENLLKHDNHVHFTSKATFCKLCNRNFRNENALKMHNTNSHKDLIMANKKKTSETPPKEIKFMCQKCRNRPKFRLQKELYNHITVFHKEIACEFCLEIFSSKYKLQKHKLDSHKNEKQEDETPLNHEKDNAPSKKSNEGDKIDQINSERKKLDNNQPEEPVRKSKRIKPTSKDTEKSTLDNTSSNVDVSSLFRCEKCEEGFKSKYFLVKHLCKSVGVSKTINCNFCLGDFERTFYEKHVKICSQLVTCCYCRQMFNNKSQIRKHFEKDHKLYVKLNSQNTRKRKNEDVDSESAKKSKAAVSETAKDDCEIESSSSTNKRKSDISEILDTATKKLKTNLESKPQDHDNEFRCTKCPEILNNKNDLEKHVLLHGTTNIKCEECSKTFRSLPLLDKHIINAHKNAIKCTTCCKVFKTLYLYSKHNRIVHNATASPDKSKRKIESSNEPGRSGTVFSSKTPSSSIEASTSDTQNSIEPSTSGTQNSIEPSTSDTQNSIEPSTSDTQNSIEPSTSDTQNSIEHSVSTMTSEEPSTSKGPNGSVTFRSKEIDISDTYSYSENTAKTNSDGMSDDNRYIEDQSTNGDECSTEKSNTDLCNSKLSANNTNQTQGVTTVRASGDFVSENSDLETLDTNNDVYSLENPITDSDMYLSGDFSLKTNTCESEQENFKSQLPSSGDTNVKDGVVRTGGESYSVIKAHDLQVPVPNTDNVKPGMVALDNKELDRSQMEVTTSTTKDTDVVKNEKFKSDTAPILEEGLDDASRPKSLIAFINLLKEPKKELKENQLSSSSVIKETPRVEHIKFAKTNVPSVSHEITGNPPLNILSHKNVEILPKLDVKLNFTEQFKTSNISSDPMQVKYPGKILLPLQSSESPEEIQVYKCARCEAPYTDKMELRQHISDKHIALPPIDEAYKKEKKAKEKYTKKSYVLVKKDQLHSVLRNELLKPGSVQNSEKLFYALNIPELKCCHCEAIFTSQKSLEAHSKAFHTHHVTEPSRVIIANTNLSGDKNVQVQRRNSVAGASSTASKDNHPNQRRSSTSGCSIPFLISTSSTGLVHVMKDPLAVDPGASTSINKELQCPKCGFQLENGSEPHVCSVFKCDKCFECFNSKELLNAHYLLKHDIYLVPKHVKNINSFTNIKNLDCKFCTAMFTKNKDLNKHYREFHKYSPHQMKTSVIKNYKDVSKFIHCTMCNDIFNSNFELQKHYLDYHNYDSSVKKFEVTPDNSTQISNLMNTSNLIHIAPKKERKIIKKTKDSTTTQLAQPNDTMNSINSLNNINSALNDALGYAVSSTVLNTVAPSEQLPLETGNLYNTLAESTLPSVIVTSIPNQIPDVIPTIEQIPQKLVNRFPCEHCTTSCTTEAGLTTHIIKEHPTVNPNVPVKCDFCSSVFQNGGELAEHTNKVHKDLQTCIQCSRKFSNKYNLKRHVAVTHDSRYECTICNEIFTKKIDLTKHRTAFHADKIFREPGVQTPSYFSTPTDYPCQICGRYLSSKYHLRRHMDNIHNKLQILSQCKVCLKGMVGINKFSSHLMNDHKIKPGSVEAFSNSAVVCNECRKIFINKKILKVHMKKKHDFKPHQCHICSRTYGFKKHITRHMEIHDSLKDFLSFSAPDDNEWGEFDTDDMEYQAVSDVQYNTQLEQSFNTQDESLLGYNTQEITQDASLQYYQTQEIANDGQVIHTVDNSTLYLQNIETSGEQMIPETYETQVLEHLNQQTLPVKSDTENLVNIQAASNLLHQSQLIQGAESMSHLQEMPMEYTTQALPAESIDNFSSISELSALEPTNQTYVFNQSENEQMGEFHEMQNSQHLEMMQNLDESNFQTTEEQEVCKTLILQNPDQMQHTMILNNPSYITPNQISYVPQMMDNQQSTLCLDTPSVLQAPMNQVYETFQNNLPPSVDMTQQASNSGSGPIFVLLLKQPDQSS